MVIKDIPGASEQSFFNRTILLQELQTTLKDPLHVLTDAYVLVFSRYRPKHFYRKYWNIVNIWKLV